MPDRQKKPAKQTRAGVNLNVYIDEDLRTAVEQYIAKYNKVSDPPATLRSTVEAALRLFLRENKCWPLDDSPTP